MDTKRATQLSLAFVFATLLAGVASAQIRIESNPDRGQKSVDYADSGSVASGQGGLVVSKTAYLQGPDVCGQIRIFNFSGFPANVVGIVDWLEVHFPNNVPPAGLVTGSDLNWFKVADLAVALPPPIAPFATLNINYCHPLCDTADHPRADYMRNVVHVTISMPYGQTRTFPARSNSFRPPVLDCQACCVPDGTCVRTVPTRCTSLGGTQRGPQSRCTSSTCLEACCVSANQCLALTARDCTSSASGTPQGFDTDCATTECCTLLGHEDCAQQDDCCDDSAFCQIAGGTTTCCILRGDTGCDDDFDCCNPQGFLLGVCENGKCCGRTGDFGPSLCSNDADCCDENAFCEISGGLSKCCIRRGDTGCDDNSDCCNPQGLLLGVCESGKCCGRTGTFGPGLCSNDADCCDENAVCQIGGGLSKCCIQRGDTGCDENADCCNPDGILLEVCDSGKCCGRTGTFGPGLCSDNSDCCDGDAVCQISGGLSTCCLPLFRSGCTTDSDCCSGLVCDLGMCNSVASP